MSLPAYTSILRFLAREHGKVNIISTQLLNTMMACCISARKALRILKLITTKRRILGFKLQPFQSRGNCPRYSLNGNPGVLHIRRGTIIIGIENCKCKFG